MQAAPRCKRDGYINTTFELGQLLSYLGVSVYTPKDQSEWLNIQDFGGKVRHLVLVVCEPSWVFHYLVLIKGFKNPRGFSEGYGG